MKYHIEIYQPGSELDTLTLIKSEKPFMALNVGDLINPLSLPQTTESKKHLKITAIEHIFFCSPDNETVTGHKILVFTEEVDI